MKTTEELTCGRLAEQDLPLIPVRMLNEFVYCPRLAYLEWVQGEFAHNADTVEGAVRHKRVDKPGGKLPDEPQAEEKIHARSVSLSSEKLGITAKIDLVEGDGSGLVPVDYKKGKRPHIAGGVYAPERVQLCAQGLLLREHGFSCDEGVIYFAGSRERVSVRFDEELIGETLSAARAFGQMARDAALPEPLEDSPKCPRCSLVGICLPDEVRFLNRSASTFRPIFPAVEKGLPLYVQSPKAWLRKDGERIVIEENRERIAEARFGDVSQLVLYGYSVATPGVLHECMRREIPVTYLSYGGWFIGHCVGTGHRNVETRIHQYRASFDSTICLKLAQGWTAAKIANCRTLFRRNRKSEETSDSYLLTVMRRDVGQAFKASCLETLLGVEGSAANRYFQNFVRMIRIQDDLMPIFDFSARNRRPPKDPVNALLSFAYAMLTREWTVTLAAVGLDPYRGFFHQPRFGRPALALDMMEPFRPLVSDSAVITAINNGEVRPDDFIHSAVGCNLTDSGRKRFIGVFERRMGQEITHPLFKYRISYRRLLEVQARLLIRFLAGEIPRYPNFVTR